MPWIFNLPDGRSLSYTTQEEDPEAGMSFPEAQARARREINPNLVNTETPYEGRGSDISPWRRNALEEAAEGRQWYRDMGDQILGGVSDIGVWLSQGVNFLDPTASGSRREGRRPIGDMLADASRDWGEEQTASLSPEFLRDQNAENPWNAGNISGMGARSLPSMAPVIAASRYGRVAGGAAEGLMGAGGVSEAIDESIRDFAAYDPDTFASSELGRQALEDTEGNYGRAVELAANRAKGVAPAVAGTLTATISRLIGEDIGSALRGASRRETQGIIARIALGAGREWLEEFLQSGQETIASNMAISQIDGRSWDEGALEAAGMGAVTAAPMGGVFGAISHATSPRPTPHPGPAGPAVQGPVMPPPGSPGSGPATGNGNPPGWTAPNTQEAEDADYVEPGERELAAQPGQAPPRPERPTDEPATNPEAEARAAEYAANYDGESPITDPADDELYAGALAEQFQSLGMAAREAPPKKKGVRRTVKPVPLYRFSREALEADDTDAAAIYAGAVERAVADGLDIGEALRSTKTFNVYSQAEQSLFADEAGNPSEAVGYGLKVTDSDGTVSFLDIGAKTLEEANANAGKFGITKDMESAKPKEAAKPPEAIKTDEAVVEPEAPLTGTAIEAKGKIKNLKPAANEALNTYRTKGERGLQAYLGGFNITASKSLLRALGGQPLRTDKMAETKGAILQRVRGLAQSADKRGLPDGSALSGAVIEEPATDPLVNDNVSPQQDAANQAVSDEEFFGEDWPANTKDAPAVTEQEQEVPKPVAPKATPKPVAPVQEQAKPKEAPKHKVEPEVVELKPRESRSPGQIKALLRDVALLEEAAYDEAVAKMKITPEEAVAVREAMKTDKGLDNLRSTFNDALASQRKTKKSRQTQEEPKAKAKPRKTEEEKEVESEAKRRKRRDASDKILAREVAANQPADYQIVRQAALDWLEMEREKQGIRSEALWRKQWPISREEALINRAWSIAKGDGPMESRNYGQGANMPYDLNPLMLFSRAERMANAFPEESSTRMHMLRWLEKRVRKPELKFIDMSEFVKGGATGNPLVDRATKQELIDYIKSRKLKLNVSYAYGRKGSVNERDLYPVPKDKAAEFAGFSTTEDLYANVEDYTLLGQDALKNNLITVAIVIEPGQPGADGAFSHIGPKGTIAAFIASDLPGVQVDGKEVTAFAVHQGQSDYHDAKPEQYRDITGNRRNRDSRITAIQDEIKSLMPEGRPYAFSDIGLLLSNPGDIGDNLLSSAVGVGGRGLSPRLQALARELESVVFERSSDRDINAPYRDTHPELMFRSAFMMAVSSGHKALAWPTADTIRMYPGHSTYKGDFYDKRWPQYAQSWLKEWKPRVLKQTYSKSAIQRDQDAELPIDAFIDREMRQEALDLISDSIPVGLDEDVEAAFKDLFDVLAGDRLKSHHSAWIDGLRMVEMATTPPPAGVQFNPRFDVDFHASQIRQVEREAVKFLEGYLPEYPVMTGDNAPSMEDIRRSFKQFAVDYFDRFVAVNDQAVESETSPGGNGNAEIYVMPITDEMRRSFLKTGAPMFSLAGPKAKTANKDIFKHAKKMARKKRSNADIWVETAAMGQPWYRNESGEWIFEAEDGQMRIMNEGTGEARDMVSYDSFYENYPQLGKMKTRVKTTSKPKKNLGSFIPFIREVTITVPARAQLTVAAHEFQHAADDVEGRKYGFGKPYGLRPGERRALNAEFRRGWSMENRIRLPPWETEADAVAWALGRHDSSSAMKSQYRGLELPPTIVSKDSKIDEERRKFLAELKTLEADEKARIYNPIFDRTRTSIPGRVFLSRHELKTKLKRGTAGVDAQNISDETLIDFDKKLSEQNPAVASALRGLLDGIGGAYTKRGRSLNIFGMEERWRNFTKEPTRDFDDTREESAHVNSLRNLLYRLGDQDDIGYDLPHVVAKAKQDGIPEQQSLAREIELLKGRLGDYVEDEQGGNGAYTIDDQYIKLLTDLHGVTWNQVNTDHEGAYGNSILDTLSSEYGTLGAIQALADAGIVGGEFSVRGTDPGKSVIIFGLDPAQGTALRTKWGWFASLSLGGDKTSDRPIQGRDVPIRNRARNRKWTNEMERAIKTAAACAAAMGPASLAPGLTAAIGLGLGAVASVPVANLLAEEGRDATRLFELLDQLGQYRREAGVAPADAYLDEEMNFQGGAVETDEEGFVQPAPPVDNEVYSPAELRAARAEIENMPNTIIPRELITPADVRRQAYIRRHGLRRHITDLNAPEPREEERIRIPQ